MPPPVGIYELEVISRKETTRYPKQIIGDLEQVKAHAAKLEQGLREADDKEHPQLIAVKAVLIETLGPNALRHYKEALYVAQTNAMIAEVMAGQLAVFRAKTRLELNPDLVNIAKQVMREAQLAVEAIRAGADALPPNSNLTAQA